MLGGTYFRRALLRSPPQRPTPAEKRGPQNAHEKKNGSEPARAGDATSAAGGVMLRAFGRGGWSVDMSPLRGGEAESDRAPGGRGRGR